MRYRDIFLVSYDPNTLAAIFSMKIHVHSTSNFPLACVTSNAALTMPDFAVILK